MNIKHLVICSLLLVWLVPAAAQKKFNPMSESTFAGMKFRNIGPAFMSGRVSDIAIHPDDDNVWYVAIGSGGIMKTTNAGTTWTPIFDNQNVYSIGCITIDPHNPHTIWVGSGENVSGRHVGFGDGVYVSHDDGQTWTNMGLKKTEHISEIIVHPEDRNTIWVAAQGPLWSKGGQRGLYKSTDGGKTWKKKLGGNEWTGVTDIAVDPRNPDRVYAVTWQRHRNVAALMDGGPGTGIHRSEDGGDTWKKLKKGLPTSNMGKIGFGLSPQQPDVVYAAIELDRRKGGVYRSSDRGESWTKMSSTVSGGTGPHYYQELYVSPHAFDRIYLADVRMKVSNDGGKTFKQMGEQYKHSDNHALAFRADDPDYLLVGTDGGVYESFDLAKSWSYIRNLPTIQYYKVAIDDALPFYNVYGGTQDNNTHGGPSRTDNIHGIRNADWEVTLFGDGHQPATEPGNPDIIYCEWQQGNLVRVDRLSGEKTYIKPQPREGEVYERYNWDAPILVSSHDPKRIYFASQRVWRSDNRGDNWNPISKDLTKNQDRLTLPIMGRVQSWDNPWDTYAMSNYNTITSLAESPINENVLYAGTDDGIIQATSNGGKSWRKINVNALPGVPKTAFVNDIKADLYDEKTVYVALDNHKYGDYRPYLYKSTDMGKTWKSISSNLPKKTLVWRLVQDHVKSGLMFAATEFGIYFTVNGGGKWVKLKGGLPTISFRDLAIHRRENDLVGASFGRGFYILDDYSALRNIDAGTLNQEAKLFTPRTGLWYIEQSPLGGRRRASQGADLYLADNPPFGVEFTYYLKDTYQTRKAKRQEKEKSYNKKNRNVPFPGWDALEMERKEMKPQVWLVIENQKGEVIRRVKAKASKGVHRVAWDLSYPPTNVVKLKAPAPRPGSRAPSGLMAAPGTYVAKLYKKIDGETTMLDQPVTFDVKPLPNRPNALKGQSIEAVTGFWRELEALDKKMEVAESQLKSAMGQIKAMERALQHSTSSVGMLDKELYDLRHKAYAIETALTGKHIKEEAGERVNPTIGDRMFFAYLGTALSTLGPSDEHRSSLDIAKKEFGEVKSSLNTLVSKDIPALMTKIIEQGGPYVETTFMTTADSQ